MSAASLIATHLNAPYGKTVSAWDVAASLKAGCLSASSKEANSLLEALFIEVAPDLILKCADYFCLSANHNKFTYHLLICAGY